jgi:hypothetical protein
MTCASCGLEFEPQRRIQRFCRPACKSLWHRRERARLAELLSISAAAAELGVSRYVVRYAIERGRLQVVCVPTVGKVGRPWRGITRREIERYRKKRGPQSRPESP